MDLYRFIYTNKKVYMNKCLCCGKEVKNKFCNTSCQNKYQKRQPTIEQIKKGQITRFGEFKSFMVVCNKCEKEFEVVEREKLHPQKEKYYCSRSCSNSHIRTKESKLKTSNSIKKLIENGNAPGALSKYKDTIKEKIILEKICLSCGKEFKTKKINQKYCSRSCSGKSRGGWNNHDKVNWSEVNKKSYANGHNYVAGGTCKWYDYKDIRVQGTYELRTCSILDRWKENGKIKDWKYTNDRFDYVGVDGKNHTYLLDFKIFENDNSFYYLETKGWEKDNDKFKWESVKEKGFRLEIWFEEDIIKNE